MILILHSVDQFSSFIFRESVLERISENCIGKINTWQDTEQLLEKNLLRV